MPFRPLFPPIVVLKENPHLHWKENVSNCFARKNRLACFSLFLSLFLCEQGTGGKGACVFASMTLWNDCFDLCFDDHLWVDKSRDLDQRKAGFCFGKCSEYARPTSSTFEMSVTYILTITTWEREEPSSTSARSIFSITNLVCAYASPVATTLPFSSEGAVPEMKI